MLSYEKWLNKTKLLLELHVLTLVDQEDDTLLYNCYRRGYTPMEAAEYYLKIYKGENK